MPIAQRLQFIALAALLVPAWTGGLSAQDQPDPRVLRGPVMGFVHDRTAGIRPILGLPGGATLGPAVLVRAGLESVAFAPGRDCGLAILARGRQVVVLRNLSAAPSAAILSVPPGPARIAFSPSGDAAVLYYSDTPRAEVLTGFPGSPSLAWSLDLAGVQGDLAALAISDGGGAILFAASGEPAPVWLAAPGEGQRMLLAVSASPSLAFLSRSEDAAIADALTGDVVLVRNPRREPRVTWIGGRAEGISRPVAIAAARDNRRLYVANAEPAGVVSLDLSGSEPFRIACSCEPAMLEPMAGGSVFRLSEAGRGPIWLLDTAGSMPRIVFVPDQARSPGGARRAPAPPRAGGVTATRSSGLLADALAIGTGSVLPWATFAEAYSQTLTASGGVPPYTWAIASGALPPGLTFDASGLLSGAPAASGPFYFTVSVADSSGGSASRAFSLLVVLPPAPAAFITGLQDNVSPAQQPEFDIRLSAAYPRDIAGSVTLTFEPDAVNSSDDPSVQFSTGGRTLNFSIPAGATSPSWPSTPAVQTGTVAGRIKLAVKFSAGEQNLTPPLAPVRTVTVALAAPQIDSIQLVSTAGGFQVSIAGYSTPREVTQAVFDFTTTGAAGSQTISVGVDLKSAFTAWYTSEPATQYGSAFLYTQPFTVQGNASGLASVSVSLSSSMGTSAAVTASF